MVTPAATEAIRMLRLVNIGCLLYSAGAALERIIAMGSPAARVEEGDDGAH
jgi:hypothetical protein